MTWITDGWPWHEDDVVVCLLHGRFMPCRTGGVEGIHEYTSEQSAVESVRAYQRGEKETW